ncbi:hypothetical protein EX30DRAFT_365758 [Ascodesmis nigricans]|uniref:Uncharacterized protein n=1 Tax=Ascodesmis nigricans TaxID=341454 RepID=A0A4S2MNQ0_9PEZI|nr:hypothetical protein EX30DRAFT_365758 [Ascodesmis nigricans]
MATLPPSTSTSPPTLRSLPITTISHRDIHLRPARLQDLPQCWTIHSYYILHHVTNMFYVPFSFGEFQLMFEKTLGDSLPYIIAVYRPSALQALHSGCTCLTRGGGTGTAQVTGTGNVMHHVWPATPYTTPEEDAEGYYEIIDKDNKNNSIINNNATGCGCATTVSNGEEEELVLGYAYLQPNFYELGHMLYMCGQNTYIHPSLRVSGIGTRLSVLMCSLVKAPERYTQYPPPGALPPAPTSSTTLQHPEQDATTYHAFRHQHIRKLHALLRRTVVDEIGLGKGKSRFFEKLGFEVVGYVPMAGVKWGRVYGCRYWYLRLEEWDEVKGALKEGVAEERRKREAMEMGFKARL